MKIIILFLVTSKVFHFVLAFLQFYYGDDVRQIALYFSHWGLHEHLEFVLRCFLKFCEIPSHYPCRCDFCTHSVSPLPGFTATNSITDRF